MFGGNIVWNTAVLEAGPGGPFDVAAMRSLALFSSRELRRRKKRVHTRADPFLWVDGDHLYLFIEVQRVGEPGHIAAYRTADLSAFEPLGEVLVAPTHLSYPLILADGGATYMIPETAEAGEVALYRFDDFPRGLTKVRRLLDGPYLDSTIVRRGEHWWLFATTPRGLELFFAPDLNAEFVSHPANPLSTDPAFMRCGGPILEWQGALYRPAQDGSDGYGRNLHMMRIETLTPTQFAETPARMNLFDRAGGWNAEGGHHLSTAQFHGRTIVAVDGKQEDYPINRVLSLLFRMVGN